jgi:radical SAM protein with 4Fe4S-binding SPASM domain
MRGIRHLFNGKSIPSSPKAGVYHFLREDDHGKARTHLRIEEDGYGLLLVNASRVLHLNPSAAFMAYLFLQQHDSETAVRAITKNFQVGKDEAEKDYAALIEQISAATAPEGGCLICDYEFETVAPFSKQPAAPYRMDLALTYRCNNNCRHCYNARSRQYPELDTNTWKQILDQLWEIGIPHIVFTGGEPTLREDLAELIAHAETNGQITGINTNGRKLKDPAYVKTLVDAGLDHVQITLESHEAYIHDEMVAANGAWEETISGIKNVLKTPLFVMTNTTMIHSNAEIMDKTLDFLGELGLPTVGLNALIYSGKGLDITDALPESALPPLLTLAREKTHKYNQRLIWYTPTQYCHFDPVQLGLGVKGCSAARYNMCIEPNGDVIPCQSYYSALGNIQKDSWDSIWYHDLSISLRERGSVPEECLSCSFLSECGGGCPLARQAGRIAPPKPFDDFDFGEREN